MKLRFGTIKADDMPAYYYAVSKDIVGIIHESVIQHLKQFNIVEHRDFVVFRGLKSGTAYEIRFNNRESFDIVKLAYG